MTDKEFLWWIHERLVCVHGERELSEYMHHLRALIIDLPCEKETPFIARVATNPTNTKEYMDGLRNAT